MADLASVKVLAIALVDEVCVAMGQPTVSSQLASIAQLQQDVINRTLERDAKQAAINSIKTDLQTALAKANAA